MGIYSGLYLSSLPLVKPKCLTKDERSKSTLSPELTEILIGLILGDLFVNKQKTCINARLEFTQGVVHMEYLQHPPKESVLCEGKAPILWGLYELFCDFCGMVAKPPTRSPDKRTGKIYDTVRFFTYSLPCFLE